MSLDTVDFEREDQNKKHNYRKKSGVWWVQKCQNFGFSECPDMKR